MKEWQPRSFVTVQMEAALVVVVDDGRLRTTRRRSKRRWLETAVATPQNVAAASTTEQSQTTFSDSFSNQIDIGGNGESENGGQGCGGVLQRKRSPCWTLNGGEVKKLGQTVSKGHQNYDLTVTLQLGMSYSAGMYVSIVRELRPGDFDPKEKFWMRFAPPHQSLDFKWKDYCLVLTILCLFVFVAFIDFFFISM